MRKDRDTAGGGWMVAYGGGRSVEVGRARVAYRGRGDGGGE